MGTEAECNEPSSFINAKMLTLQIGQYQDAVFRLTYNLIIIIRLLAACISNESVIKSNNISC